MLLGNMDFFNIFLALTIPLLTKASDCGTLVSDLSQDNCIAKSKNTTTYYYSYSPETSCFPKCELYPNSGIHKGSCPCPPAYNCERRCNGTEADYSDVSCSENADCSHLGVNSSCTDMCITNTESCMAYHAYTEEFMDNFFTAEKFKPSCTNDGDWSAKQCKGGVSGRCFCFDASGNRLYGEAKYSESEDMTCACSRRRAYLLASGRYFVSLHCDSMGNYEKLQCDNGLCWCAEPKTGELTAPIVPEKVMTKLPCYDSAEVGDQYLRKCESKLNGIETAIYTLEVHGVSYASFGTLVCDGNGGYGAYNVSSGIAYCTWNDGTIIGTWQSDISTGLSDLNCNCARDYKRYQHTLSCSGNGNYNQIQNMMESKTTKYYCVDSDGFAKSDLMSVQLSNCSSYY